MRQKKKSIWLVPMAVTLITLFLLKSVFLIGYVPTACMEPTIKQGSFVVGLRFYGKLEREDIIIFRHDGKLLVKRIAAFCGESVRWREGTLCVPEEAYYVLGDNADNSNDSRFWEDPFVSKESVEGEIIFIVSLFYFI